MLCRRSVEPGIGSASHRPGEERGVGGTKGINWVDWGQEQLRRSQESTPRMGAFGCSGIAHPLAPGFC